VASIAQGPLGPTSHRAHQTHQHAPVHRQTFALARRARAFLLARLPRTTHAPRTKRAASSATRRIAIRSSRTDPRRVQLVHPTACQPAGPVPEADLNPAPTRAKRARQALNLCKPANLQACTRRTPPGIHGAHPSRKLMGSAPFASRSLPRSIQTQLNRKRHPTVKGLRVAFRTGPVPTLSQSAQSPEPRCTHNPE
jgi:hypothetical protein